MPYITCDDGHTYSRYDTSPYVCDCIKKERAYYDSLDRVCMQDPVCKAKNDNLKLGIEIVAGVVITLIIGFLIALCKDLK
jgi:hypothetical protein